jgi:hypothetical protein
VPGQDAINIMRQSSNPTSSECLNRSGEPFHVLQCERGAGQSQFWSKKPLEEVGRG